MAIRKNADEDPVLSELIAIKRLLIFGIMRGGASQAQIAAALGLDQSQVSRMMGKAPGRGRSK